MGQSASSPATGPHAPAGFGPHGADVGAVPWAAVDDGTEAFVRVETELVGPARPETAADLTADRLLRRRSAPPSRGWRRAVWEMTGRRVQPPETRGERERRDLRGRAQLPVSAGHHRVAVMSLKGGVGKTTTTIVLGATLADVRGDRVIAVDANPDRGTLAERVRLETAGTVRDLLADRSQILRYADARAFTSQASSRLEVLASDRDPAVSEAFSADDYADAARVIERFYSICLTDCGTGLLHSAMGGVLGLADQLVIVSSPAVDGARSASATVDWLDAHGYRDLARTAVVALTSVRRMRGGPVDIDGIVRHFSRRCRDVVRIPYDPHLVEGGEISLERLAPATADAYLRLSAAVADRFPGG